MQAKTTPIARVEISDRITTTASGYAFLIGGLGGIVAAAVIAYMALGINEYGLLRLSLPTAGLAALVLVASITILSGLYTIQPNQSAVLVLFGKYMGTDNRDGFRWTNPFAGKHIVSRRTNSFETSVLKVNDGNGNPIEIAAAVMWRVDDAARAHLQVENYTSFVKVQAEASVRTMANSHPYDHHDEADEKVTDAPVPKEVIKRQPSLLGGGDEVSDSLKDELSARLAVAGIVIEDARITHLAYAQEIAPAMLRRQQAQAIIAAKRKIVEGAVGMVKEAMTLLKDDYPVDEDRRAALVSNLLVVLVADREAQPVVNAGSVHG